MEYAISHETIIYLCAKKGNFSLGERSLYHGSNKERYSKGSCERSAC